MVLMMLDASKADEQRPILERELETMGIRLNREPPAISFRVKPSGGLSINSTVPLTHLDDRMIRMVLHEYKIFNAEILFRCDATVDDLIDVVETQMGAKRVYMPCLYVYNKIDTLTIEEVDRIARRPHTVVISCELNLNLDYLIDVLWQELDLRRVYTKRRGEAPDFSGPVIIRRGGTVLDVCNAIHRSLAEQFRYALVWGRSTKHNPQRVGLSHELADEDVIQIVKKQ
jgi:ribosome-interacting GTPase 1